MGNTKNVRLQWLDALRAIASISVVYFHLNEVLPLNTELSIYRAVVKQGWLGVPVFFFVSGYCIKMVVNKSGSALGFWKRRFWRIFPNYYFSLSIVLLVVLIRYFAVGHNDVAELPQTPFAIFATLTLMTAPATSVPGITWVYWSLTYEVVFYLLTGLTMFFNKGFRENVFIAITIFSWFYLFLDKQFFFFLNQWPSFAMGYFAYLWLEDKKKVGLFGLVVSLVSLAFNFPFLSDKSSFAHVSALGLTFLCILLAKHKTIQLPTLLNKIGLSSYSLYLIHVPIGVYLFARYRNEFVLSHPFFHLCVDTLIVSILLALSWLMFKYIETPFIQYGKTDQTKML